MSSAKTISRVKMLVRTDLMPLKNQKICQQSGLKLSTKTTEKQHHLQLKRNHYSHMNIFK